MRVTLSALSFLLAFAGTPAGFAATDPGSNARLQDAAHFGGMAAVAPLCNLRDAAWARDLRRAETQELGRARDAIGALSYGDDEALEDFAEANPDRSCAALARDPDLARADRLVEQYRRLW